MIIFYNFQYLYLRILKNATKLKFSDKIGLGSFKFLTFKNLCLRIKKLETVEAVVALGSFKKKLNY